MPPRPVWRDLTPRSYDDYTYSAYQREPCAGDFEPRPWEIIDRISRKYAGAPYARREERIVSVIEPKRQIVGGG
jgi:hypothetical protein